MNLLDKLYLNIYWCGDKGKGSKIVDLTFDWLFMIPLFGIMNLILTFICMLIHVDLTIAGLLILSGISSFFLSEILVKKYYTEEKKKQIISEYKKPKFSRYIVLFVTVIFGMGIAIILFLISGIIYHRYII